MQTDATSHTVPGKRPGIMAQRWQRWQLWLMPIRAPEPGEVYLNQRRVYIVPSSAGFAFAGMLALLFVASINYNLSLGFALTFLLAACGVIDMHLTFRNLAYLHLKPGRCNNVFAGEQASFELHLMNRRHYDRFAIWLGFDDAPAQACDIEADGHTTLTLSTPALQRGVLAIPRVRLQAGFPLGLLRTWAYWRPVMQVLVYPRPEDDAPPLPQTGTQRAGGRGSAGHDDFAGVRHYQAGDPLKHLAWRQIARLDPELGGQLVSKQFEGGGNHDLLLDFAHLPHDLDLELRLSRMTRWLLEAEHLGVPYAFRLGNHDFPNAKGEAHLHACLQALALYQLAESRPQPNHSSKQQP